MPTQILHNDSVDIGRTQQLTIGRESPHGFYLTDGTAEVLLPRGQCPPDAQIGDAVKVFVLTDSEDRPVATTKKPRGEVGDFAALRIVGFTPAGAFLDWGLDKDLFLPRREQTHSLREGEKCVVRIYLDEVSNRVACTMRVGRYLKAASEALSPGEKVQILVVEKMPGWISVIVNGTIKASIFPDEWHDALRPGDVRDAYVKAIRPEDGRLAISLRPQGFKAALGERDRILEQLRENGGRLPVSDKSSPEEIHRMFGLSKAMFKRIIGSLYKAGVIDLEAGAIRLKR